MMVARSFCAWKLLVAAQTQDERNHLRRKRTAFRKVFNPLHDLGDVEFRNRFTKEAFLFLCHELEQLTSLKSANKPPGKGDSGYIQRPWLMTPFLEVSPGSPEENHNVKHSKARVVIENTFGRLKNRWRCLSKDRVLHYKPKKCAKIIQAYVLYNIALDQKVPEECIDQPVPSQPENVVRETESTNDLVRGRAYRDQLVARLQC